MAKPGQYLRTSHFETLEAALAVANDMMGVVAIEELGVGIVWHKANLA